MKKVDFTKDYYTGIGGIYFNKILDRVIEFGNLKQEIFFGFFQDKKLGWKPKHDFEPAMKTIEWYKNNVWWWET